MNYRISHRTVYDYSEPVTVSHHAARLTPRITRGQTFEDFTIHIEPEPTIRKLRLDYFGNGVCFFSIQSIHQRLEVTASSIVVTSSETPVATGLSPGWESVARLFRDPVSPDVVEPFQFVFDSPLLCASPELAAYAAPSFTPGRPLLAAVSDLTQRIYREFEYDPVATTVSTPPAEVFAARHGVCQDFAHVAIACLRSMGLPARYVSGYLRTIPAPGQPKLVGADASHAWFSVFSPGLGWVDFDPTNGVMPSEDHISVAFGRDFSDVSPLSGIITGGGEHTVDVAVDVDAS
ncbi:MAG TPA: transglutaminase family protein [Candidatus Limnocylindrales bacterium]|nr:transglutaminase family protein [Candidatus Limnocylindrales bacterium]